MWTYTNLSSIVQRHKGLLPLSLSSCSAFASGWEGTLATCTFEPTMPQHSHPLSIISWQQCPRDAVGALGLCLAETGCCMDM